MEKILKVMGWKDYNGRWDTEEIFVDVKVTAVVVFVLMGIYILEM